MSGKVIEGALDPYASVPLPDTIEHKVERPCGHVQIIMGPPAADAIGHSKYIAPVLREAIKGPCPECAKALV